MVLSGKSSAIRVTAFTLAASCRLVDFYIGMLYNNMQKGAFIMKYIKRTLAGTVAAALILSAGVSCENKKSSETKESTSTPEEMTDVTEPVTEDP